MSSSLADLADLADVDTLASTGWVAMPARVDAAVCAGLLAWAKELSARGDFKLASIKASKKVNTNVRSDSIYWIEDWQAAPELELIRKRARAAGTFLSRELRMVLKSFECHLSHYSPGDFYLKHLDQHLETRHRQITMVLYLNACEGGELVLYNKDNRNQVDAVIAPEAGKVVLFLSSMIFHEVKSAATDRFGLTGWFRDDENLFHNRLAI